MRDLERCTKALVEPQANESVAWAAADEIVRAARQDDHVPESCAQTAVRTLSQALASWTAPSMEAAFVALAALDDGVATTAGYTMFGRAPSHGHGLATRLVRRMNGGLPPTTDVLLLGLASESNLTGMLSEHALGELGREALPALMARARSLTSEGDDSTTWLADEGTRGRIAFALGRIGAPSAIAMPMLLDWLEAGWHYRDTRFRARRALAAIGRDAASAVIAALETRCSYALLDVLYAMPPDVLESTAGVVPAMDRVLAGGDEALMRIATNVLEKLIREG